MKIENHILDILQLYEYAMAIGRSLDYKESCDLFLKLVLKRKNLNAAWILESRDNVLQSTYAIPFGKEIEIKKDEGISELLDNIDFAQIVNSGQDISAVAPIAIEGGVTAIFNLKDEGYLFLYSKKDNLTAKDLSQLEPVIRKFTVNLKSCKAFNEQEQLLSSLEAQNQELSDYAHMVSHDLKSPLRSIEALASWLSNDYSDSLDSTGKEYLGMIQDKIESMENLISGILAYSTANTSELNNTQIDLNEVMTEIVDSIYIPNNVKVIAPKRLPQIIADRTKTHQLFQNIISNAVVHIEKENGKVEVIFKEDPEYWEFCIRDNGIGIPKKFHKKIFDIFQSASSDKKSTGIGLSIVKKIVDRYNGEVWVESEEGEGTDFYFTLEKQNLTTDLHEDTAGQKVT